MNKFDLFSLILTIIILIELVLGACSIFTMSTVTLYTISFCGWLSLFVRDCANLTEE